MAGCPAQSAPRAKTEFLANMSHELRTPLTSVIGFAGLLKQSGDLGPDERRYVDRIATSSDALLGVINDILDYSKLEAEAVGLDPLAFDPRAMIAGAAGIVESQCEAKGLTLVQMIDSGLPAGLMGDEGRLRQVRHGRQCRESGTRLSGSSETPLCRDAAGGAGAGRADRRD